MKGYWALNGFENLTGCLRRKCGISGELTHCLSGRFEPELTVGPPIEGNVSKTGRTEVSS